eukprot:GHVS01073561.1.p1 GENE.GHVS01073561.1~~GHVS01073561.1.p1  ORF type:complete len:238 (+),score=33.79 GHVS01073561.1:916-1629(+)
MKAHDELCDEMRDSLNEMVEECTQQQKLLEHPSETVIYETQQMEWQNAWNSQLAVIKELLSTTARIKFMKGNELAETMASVEQPKASSTALKESKASLATMETNLEESNNALKEAQTLSDELVKQKEHVESKISKLQKKFDNKVKDLEQLKREKETLARTLKTCEKNHAKEVKDLEQLKREKETLARTLKTCEENHAKEVGRLALDGHSGLVVAVTNARRLLFGPHCKNSARRVRPL